MAVPISPPSLVHRVTRLSNKAQLRRRRSKPPSTDQAGSAFAAGLERLLAPLLTLVRKHVLPLTDPDFKEDAAGFETITKEFGNFRVALFERLLSGSALDAWRAARKVSDQNKGEFQRLLSVDVFGTEPWLRPLAEDWVAENVSRVRGMGEAALADMEQTILRMVRGGASKVDIQKQIEERFAVGVNRAKLIARDQVSKFNGQLTKERQTRLGIIKYRWRTSEDIRVREEHRRLNGKIFFWAKPPITNKRGEHNHPGGDVGCRCWAEPIMDDILS